jgi:23S rRNA (cytosine1962-C5)-methyltransferase
MPTVRITRRAADRLKAGHLWIYRTDIEAHDAEGAAGSLVTVTDNRGPLGTAIYSTASKIAARLISSTPDLPRESYLAEIRSRIAAAVELRRELAPVSEANNAHRLLFSEADNVPGILADRYNDLVLVQLLTQATAQDDVRATVADALREGLTGSPLTIWERPDPRIRELEELPAPPPGPLFTTFTEGEAPARTSFHLNGLRFHYDAAAGQKTGAFLDQRLNYAAAAEQVRRSTRRERALDICTYHGGFALHLAQVCERVTGVDASHAALQAADHNLALNAGLSAKTDWIEADAFEYLRHLDVQPNKYDAIVLDPPAFAKSKRAAEGALRGYKELNLRAIRLLQPGGTLVTNSCSHHVSLEEFVGLVSSAAADAHRRVQLLEICAAAPDHPEVLTLPETRYLKCLICRVG